MASLALESRLGGPIVHHASNLLVHVASVTLLYALLVAGRAGRGLAFVMALLFSVHPANVTDIRWISGRTDLLCGLGYLAGLVGFLRFAATTKARWLLLAHVGLAWSLLSKEMGATFVAEAAALTWLLTLRGALPRAALRSRAVLVGFATLAASTIGYLVYVEARFGGAHLFGAHVGFGSVARALAGFAVLAATPLPQYLIVDAYRSHPHLAAGALGAMALAGAAGLAWRGRHGLKRASSETLAATLVVTIPCLPLMSGVATTVGRVLYIPLGVLLVATAAVVPPGARRRAVPLVGILCLVFAIPGVTAARSWVDASRVAREHCETFRPLWQARELGAPIVLLTYPAFLDDANVYANDAATTLHHCVHDEYGKLAELHAYAPIVSSSMGDEPGAIDEPATRSFERSLEAAQGYYDFQVMGFGADGSRDELGELVATKIDERGRVRAFRLRLDPGPMLILESRGGRFVRVAGALR